MSVLILRFGALPHTWVGFGSLPCLPLPFLLLPPSVSQNSQTGFVAMGSIQMHDFFKGS